MSAELNHPESSLFVPDHKRSPDCFSRTTHLGIGAHQDDLEIMAFHGIASCYSQRDLWFGGITCTDGVGAPRTGLFSSLSDEQYRSVREMEQQEAATIGGYSFSAQLGFSSEQARNGYDLLVQDLMNLLYWSRPTVVYAHNPADKHPTHIGVLKATLKAIHQLPPEYRPQQLLGCEVWRDLDWLPDDRKVLLNVTGYELLSQRLLEVFASQVTGGKRYDLAAIGRRRANATFLEAHHIDQVEQAIFAIDLTPMIQDEKLTFQNVLKPLMDQFSEDVLRFYR